MRDKNIIWIAWEDDGSIRSKVLAKEINAGFYTFTLFEGVRLLSPLRYFTAMLQTFFTLLKERPGVLIVPSPSVFLAFFSALAKPMFNYKLVIDLHTLCIDLKGIKKFIRDFLNDYSLQYGNIVIVTNEPYKNKIKEKTDKKIFVLPDKIPDFNYELKKIPLKGKYNILFVCTFSEDEPWKDVIESAKFLDNDTVIYISGKNKPDKNNIPSNVILTGFLPDEDYQNLLRSVDIIMVLTNKEDCMVCGAYEAVAAEKPLILSDKKVLREYFDKGTVFTENNSKSIAESVNLTIKNNQRLKEDIKELKRLRNTEWKESWKNLLEKLFFN